MISEDEIIASYIKTYCPEKVETLHYFMYKAAFIVGDALKLFAKTFNGSNASEAEEGVDDDT